MTGKIQPSAVVIIGTTCAHCAQVMDSLQELVKDGSLSRVEIINAEIETELAASLGVRSVPWIRIGPFVLEGSHSTTELRQWANRVTAPDGMAWYFDEQLKDGKLAIVEKMIKEEPDRLSAIILLASDTNTAIQTRIGIGALLEGLEGFGIARFLVPELGKLTRHPNARVKADACHYLALCENPDAITFLESCIDDADPTVREIAAESIEHLASLSSTHKATSD
ncbi:MAG: HEAT repeat domain-containing protein [Acidiferrobacterales bacterium]